MTVMDEIQDRADVDPPGNGMVAAQDQTTNSRHTEKPWLFKPGQSGNPGGRPKGQSLAALIREFLEQDEIGDKKLSGGKRVKDLLVEALFKQALKGDHRHLQEILNRVDGRPVERIDVTSQDGPIFVGLLARLDAHDLDTLESIADKLLAGGPRAIKGGDPSGEGEAKPD
jgi:hypothetical protein